MRPFQPNERASLHMPARSIRPRHSSLSGRTTVKPFRSNRRASFHAPPPLDPTTAAQASPSANPWRKTIARCIGKAVGQLLRVSASCYSRDTHLVRYL